MNQKTLLDLAKKHGTPLFVVDHAELRKNYALFRRHFPRVQIYYAVKVNSDPAIVKTFYELGGSFDVASMQEFHTVHENIAKLPAKQRQDFIWDKIIYANPIKPVETLEELDRYKPLVTYDNHEEVKKIAKHAPHAGLARRLGAQVVGGAVVGGVEGAHLQQSRHVGFATGGDHSAGQVDVGAFEAATIAPGFVQDADEIDDHVATGKGGPQEVAVVGVAAAPFQPRQHREREERAQERDEDPAGPGHAPSVGNR